MIDLDFETDLCYPEHMNFATVAIPTAAELEELGAETNAVLAQLAKRALDLGATFYVHGRMVMSQADVDSIRKGEFS